MAEETSGNGTFLTLGAAARHAGLSKATISKAIKYGKLSAERCLETGSFKIHVAELGRYLEAVRVVRVNADNEHPETDKPPPSTALETRLAVAEAKMVMAERQVADLHAMLEDVKSDRDRWHTQATQAQEHAAAVTRLLPGPTPERRRWWWRRRAG